MTMHYCISNINRITLIKLCRSSLLSKANGNGCQSSNLFPTTRSYLKYTVVIDKHFLDSQAKMLDTTILVTFCLEFVGEGIVFILEMSSSGI